MNAFKHNQTNFSNFAQNPLHPTPNNPFTLTHFSPTSFRFIIFNVRKCSFLHRSYYYSPVEYFRFAHTYPRGVCLIFTRSLSDVPVFPALLFNGPCSWLDDPCPGGYACSMSRGSFAYEGSRTDKKWPREKMLTRRRQYIIR